MKQIPTCITVITVLALSVPALASPVGCGSDCISIAYDETGYGVPCLTQAGGVASVYIVLLRPTETSGVSGWECHLEWTETAPVSPTGFVVYGDALNVSMAPDFVVGLTIPRPYSESILLASFTVVIYGPDCAEFWLREADTPSIPGTPVYAAAHDPGVLVPATPCTSGMLGFPLFMNCGPCDVPSGGETWGGVKAIYR